MIKQAHFWFKRMISQQEEFIGLNSYFYCSRTPPHDRPYYVIYQRIEGDVKVIAECWDEQYTKSLVELLNSNALRFDT